jgi:hypothetical protein
MNFDFLIPILDSLSQVGAQLPFRWVAVASAVLAGVVVVLKKLQASRPALQVVPPQAPSSAPQADATVAKIVADTLNKK